MEAKLELLQTRIHPSSFFSSDWSMGNIQSMRGELLFGKDQFDVVTKKFPVNDVYNNIVISKAGLGLNSSPNNFNFTRLSVDDGLNKGIKFINPNAKAVCGCGESLKL